MADPKNQQARMGRQEISPKANFSSINKEKFLQALLGKKSFPLPFKVLLANLKIKLS